MNLQGSITELQDRMIDWYQGLEHRFKENQLIRELWTAMAHDVAQQKRSMHVLAPSFWQRLKAEQGGIQEAVSATREMTENIDDLSLKKCFEHALAFEETAILRIYVPIIRKLRENWTERALDFYIMVKAHLARILRVTQMYAGDPVILQRANLLLQRFEKDVQEPRAEAAPVVAHRVRAGQPPAARREAAPQKAAPKKKTAPQPRKTLSARGKSHHGRTKPVAEKILPRRRARR